MKRTDPDERGKINCRAMSYISSDEKPFRLVKVSFRVIQMILKRHAIEQTY